MANIGQSLMDIGGRFLDISARNKEAAKLREYQLEDQKATFAQQQLLADMDNKARDALQAKKEALEILKAKTKMPTMTPVGDGQAIMTIPQYDEASQRMNFAIETVGERRPQNRLVQAADGRWVVVDASQTGDTGVTGPIKQSNLQTQIVQNADGNWIVLDKSQLGDTGVTGPTKQATDPYDKLRKQEMIRAEAAIAAANNATLADYAKASGQSIYGLKNDDNGFLQWKKSKLDNAEARKKAAVAQYGEASSVSGNARGAVSADRAAVSDISAIANGASPSTANPPPGVRYDVRTPDGDVSFGAPRPQAAKNTGSTEVATYEEAAAVIKQRYPSLSDAQVEDFLKTQNIFKGK